MIHTTKLAQTNPTDDLLFAGAQSVTPQELSALGCSLLLQQLWCSHRSQTAQALALCCPTEKPVSCWIITQARANTAGHSPPQRSASALLPCGTKCQRTNSSWLQTPGLDTAGRRWRHPLAWKTYIFYVIKCPRLPSAKLCLTYYEQERIPGYPSNFSCKARAPGAVPHCSQCADIVLLLAGCRQHTAPCPAAQGTASSAMAFCSVLSALTTSPCVSGYGSFNRCKSRAVYFFFFFLNIA